MVTLATSNSAKKLITAGISNRARTGKTEENFNELRLNLSNELQSSLDLDITLRTFFERVDSVVACDGLRFHCREKGIDISLGTAGTHSAGYNVSSKTDQLGELQFFRRHPFAETELAFLEMLLGILFFPLRNALTYREALANSYIDALTNLNNRQALEISSAREIKLAQRHNKSLSMLVIDIDHFKCVNDNYGHLSGDAVLSEVANIVHDTLRESDQIFRYGGEEFVALLTETHMEHALLTAERIRSALAKAQISEHKIKISASVGVAALTKDDDFGTLFRRADAALYRAKQNGRNQVQSQRIGHEIKRTA